VVEAPQWTIMVTKLQILGRFLALVNFDSPGPFLAMLAISLAYVDFGQVFQSIFLAMLPAFLVPVCLGRVLQFLAFSPTSTSCILDEWSRLWARFMQRVAGPVTLSAAFVGVLVMGSHANMLAITTLPLLPTSIWRPPAGLEQIVPRFNALSKTAPSFKPVLGTTMSDTPHDGKEYTFDTARPFCVFSCVHRPDAVLLKGTPGPTMRHLLKCVHGWILQPICRFLCVASCMVGWALNAAGCLYMCADMDHYGNHVARHATAGIIPGFARFGQKARGIFCSLSGSLRFLGMIFCAFLPPGPAPSTNSSAAVGSRCSGGCSNAGNGPHTPLYRTTGNVSKDVVIGAKSFTTAGNPLARSPSKFIKRGVPELHLTLNDEHFAAIDSAPTGDVGQEGCSFDFRNTGAPTPQAGNCFFESLSMCLSARQTLGAYELRKQVAHHMMAHPHFCNPTILRSKVILGGVCGFETSDSWADFCRLHAQTSTFAERIDLLYAADWLQVRIWVHVPHPCTGTWNATCFSPGDVWSTSASLPDGTFRGGALTCAWGCDAKEEELFDCRKCKAKQVHQTCCSAAVDVMKKERAFDFQDHAVFCSDCLTQGNDEPRMNTADALFGLYF